MWISFIYTVSHACMVVVTTLLGKLLLAIACTVLAQAHPHDVTAHHTSYVVRRNIG